MTKSPENDSDETPRAPFEGPPTQQPKPSGEAEPDDKWAPQSSEATAPAVDRDDDERSA